MSPPTPVQRTLSAYFAATRAMDGRAWVACFAPDGASHDPVGAPPHVGHDALRRYFDSIVDLAKSIGLHEDHVFVCGNEVAVKWTGRGVGKKNGKAFTFEGIDMFEFDDQGRIRAVYAYWDPAKLMSQLA